MVPVALTLAGAALAVLVNGARAACRECPGWS
jgi:hypothetical protein